MPRKNSLKGYKNLNDLNAYNFYYAKDTKPKAEWQRPIVKKFDLNKYFFNENQKPHFCDKLTSNAEGYDDDQDDEFYGYDNENEQNYAWDNKFKRRKIGFDGDDEFGGFDDFHFVCVR